MGATFDEVVPSHDLEPRVCRWLETAVTLAVCAIVVALGAVWLLPPATAPADCAAVGAPESPAPSPSALCGDSGAETKEAP